MSITNSEIAEKTAVYDRGFRASNHKLSPTIPKALSPRPLPRRETPRSTPVSLHDEDIQAEIRAGRRRPDGLKIIESDMAQCIRTDVSYSV